LLLDDELLGLTYMKMLCEQLPEIEVVKAFNNPITLLEEIASLSFDFCILDIEMPEMNGLQIANLIDGKPVIFATAYKDYAVDAFDLNAIDYIQKPIKIDRLKQAIQKVIQHLQIHKKVGEKTFFQHNTDKGKTLFYFDKIALIRTSDTDSRDKVVLLVHGVEFVLKNSPLKKLLEILPASDFCQVNKKEIISIKSIQAFSFDEITTNILINGKNLKITVGEIYRNDFLQKVKI